MIGTPSAVINTLYVGLHSGIAIEQAVNVVREFWTNPKCVAARQQRDSPDYSLNLIYQMMPLLKGGDLQELAEKAMREPLAFANLKEHLIVLLSKGEPVSDENRAILIKILAGEYRPTTQGQREHPRSFHRKYQSVAALLALKHHGFVLSKSSRNARNAYDVVAEATVQKRSTLEQDWREWGEKRRPKWKKPPVGGYIPPVILPPGND